MNYSKKLLACTLSCALAATPLAHATDHSTSPSSANASKSEVVGVGAGVAIGAAVGGPVGAILGMAIGGHYGDTRHRANTQKQLAEVRKTELASSQRQLSASLSAQSRLDSELLAASAELDALNQRIEQLFVERALVHGLQFDVHFDTDDTSLADTDRTQLLRLSRLLKALPEAEVELYGYADTRGAAEHNDTLSLDRAYSVADTLNELGVAQDQMRTYALGETESSYTGDDPDAYAHDRRVSIRLQLPESVASEALQKNVDSVADAISSSRGQ